MNMNMVMGMNININMVMNMDIAPVTVNAYRNPNGQAKKEPA